MEISRLLGLAAAGFALSATTFGAEVPISIGGSFQNTNIPYVTITLCEPGTGNCQTITDIELDTGSSGLRLFGSVLKLNLKPEQSAGSDVAECVQFGGGDILWGPVELADVVLGGEKAAGVPIQVASSQEGSAPAVCNGTPLQDPKSFGANGILGISPASTDCDGMKCPGTTPGKHYFTCKGSKCVNLSPTVAEQVQNPVVKMPVDHNGIIVTFPTLNSVSGLPTGSGVMTLGVGTQTDNQPAPGAQAYATDPDGILSASFQGGKYWTKFDTGTSYWTLPVPGSIPLCTGANNSFLCPPAPLSLSFSALGTNGTVSPPVAFTIADADAQLNSNNLVLSDVAWNNADPGSFLIALPFFFGRSVLVGIDGQTTPLGKGPFYGY